MDSQTAIIIYAVVSLFIIAYSFTIWQKNKAHFKKLLLWTIAITVQQLGVFFIILEHSLPEVFSSIIAGSLIILSTVFLIESINSIADVKSTTKLNYTVLSISIVLLVVFYYIWELSLIRIIIFSTSISFLTLNEFRILFINKRQYAREDINLVIQTVLVLGITFFIRTAVYIIGEYFYSNIIDFFEILYTIINLIGNIFVALGIITIISNSYMNQLSIKNNKYEQLLEKVNTIADTDDLTGLANRRYFARKAKEEIERASRYHHKLSLIMVDLDYFKEINDTYGHDVGDDLLIEIGNTLQSHVRSTDTVTRWGGDEFLILLLEAGQKETMAVASKLLEAINHTVFNHGIQITASIGISEYVIGESYASWFKKVDNAVYKAKALGKNSIFFCDEVDNIKIQLAHLKTNKKHLSGISSIDYEHEYILALLFEMYEKRTSQPELFKKANALMQYAKIHSLNEENEMLKSMYPDYNKHHLAHEIMFENAAKSLDSIENSLDDFSRESIIYIMKEMIVEHFATYDMYFFEYLKGSNQPTNT